jgi:MFS transporter, DHA1 family, inner membrane transport protein
MFRKLFVLAIGTFAIGTDGFVIAGILPDVSESLDVSIARAGQLVTVFSMVYALMSPTLAATTARWNRKRLLLSALAVFVIGNVLTALAPTFGLVLASRVVAALGAAAYFSTATAVAATLAPPEQRGRALAVVLGGTTMAVAFGAPLGSLIGSYAGWRATMWFVTALGALCFVSIAAALPEVPKLPPVSIAQRLAPLKDAKVTTALLTTMLAFLSLYSVYTYISVAFDRATGGSTRTLTLLLFSWGVVSIVGNYAGGRLTDKLGNRVVINTVLAILVVDFALMPLSGAHLATTIVTLVVWSIAGFALLVPLQHRLVGIAPTIAPVVLGLNSSALFIAISLSGLAGAGVISLVGVHNIGLVAAIGLALALIVAEIANRLIARGAARQQAAPAPTSAAPIVGR